MEETTINSPTVPTYDILNDASKFGTKEHIEAWLKTQRGGPVKIYPGENKPEPVLFAEWIRLSFNPSSNNGDQWWNRENPIDENKYTTMQLYDIFKQLPKVQ